MLLLSIIFCCCNSNGQKEQGENLKEVNPLKRELTRNQQEQAKRLEKIFHDLNMQGQFNGNVLIERNDTIIFCKSFGYSDYDKKIQLNDSSTFQLASVSKTITAAAVLMLVDWEIINLNDPVKKYISEFPYSNVTIQHLLTHRSGLPNYIHLCAPSVKNHTGNFNNDEIICFLDSTKPKEYTKPDKKFDYSNTNYFLLASIVERSTGVTFDNFVKAKIFTPLGMKHTFFYTDTTLYHQHNKTKRSEEHTSNSSH